MKTAYEALAAAMLLAWLLLAVFGPRKTETGGALADMRYGPAWRSLALILALVGPLIMLFVLWNFLWRTETRLNIAGAAFLVTSVIMALPLIEVTRTHVVLTEDGLTRFSAWSGPVALRWTEIERVRYSAVNRSFIIEGAGRTIRLSRHLSGVGVFVNTVKRKLATATWAGAADVMQ